MCRERNSLLLLLLPSLYPLVFVFVLPVLSFFPSLRSGLYPAGGKTVPLEPEGRNEGKAKTKDEDGENDQENEGERDVFIRAEEKVVQ